MGREDISSDLIHFTKGDSEEAAFKTLQKILRERRLIGKGTLIKGGYRCVCFSEAPIAGLRDGLVNEDLYSKYSPFGVMVSKKWLFAQGGRPVVYQPVGEWENLPEGIRWRHMTYEIRDGYDFTDFTWEREWRIHCDELLLAAEIAAIVVLNSAWAERLVEEHDRNQSSVVQQYAVILNDDIIAEMYREKFPWKVQTLQ